MVVVKLGGNYIDQPMKSCSTKDMITAYHAIWKCWEATGGISSNWHLIESVAHEEFKDMV